MQHYRKTTQPQHPPTEGLDPGTEKGWPKDQRDETDKAQFCYGRTELWGESSVESKGHGAPEHGNDHQGLQ